MENDDNIKVHITCCEAGSSTLMYSGKVNCYGIEFPFTIHKVTNGKLAITGRMCAVNPVVGGLITKRGSAKTAGKSDPDESSDDGNVGESAGALSKGQGKYNYLSRNFSSIKVLDRSEIKKLLTKVAAAFYKENKEYLDRLFSKTPREGFSLMDAQRVFGDSCFKSNGAKDSTINGNMNAVGRVAQAIGPVPMKEVTRQIVKKAVSLFNVSERDLRTACKYWAYCCERKHVYSGTNPIDEYFKLYHPRKVKDTGKLDYEAKRLHQLTDDEEKKLYDNIADNISNGKFMGILLVHGAGLCMTDAVKLKWGALTFSSDDYDRVTISYLDKPGSGATHNYTHPVFPDTGRLLHERYDYLAARYGESTISGFYVISNIDPTAGVKSGDEHSFIKQRLMEITGKGDAFVPYSQSIRGISPGVRLLMDDYRNRLINCGLEWEPGLLAFLQHHQIPDVTSDNYRSFTSNEGQNYIYEILCRAKRFCPQPKAEKPGVKQLGNGILGVPIPSGGYGSIAAATVRITLKAGDKLVISGNHGVKVKASCEKATPARKRKNQTGT